MKRKIKMIFMVIAIVIVIISVGTSLFLNLSPQFGASKKEIRTDAVANSNNFKDGVFENIEETKVMTEFKLSTFFDFFTDGDKIPDIPVPVQKINVEDLNKLADSLTRITWFGHSTVLIEADGKTIFIDPMLGMVPSPISWAGSKRFNPELPIDIDELPFIDVVLITHDHYDHLDYESILKLKDKVGRFYTPLGVGAHLISWGVSKGKITEMDWWDEKSFEEFTFVSAPARHFSGRGMFDRNCTQWCSWIIQTTHSKIFFSGDGGYGDHFKVIGDKYGPFDFTMMECGQYNAQWGQIHMLPEELPKAQKDLKGKSFMPIHWGAFKLALHKWTDPIDRLIQNPEVKELNMITPVIGESFIIGQDQLPQSQWWEK
jgi:L-ascorbate metabolism protein UlaG (beta-lactamase superfamily)